MSQINTPTGQTSSVALVDPATGNLYKVGAAPAANSRIPQSSNFNTPSGPVQGVVLLGPDGVPYSASGSTPPPSPVPTTPFVIHQIDSTEQSIQLTNADLSKVHYISGDAGATGSINFTLPTIGLVNKEYWISFQMICASDKSARRDLITITAGGANEIIIYSYQETPPAPTAYNQVAFSNMERVNSITLISNGDEVGAGQWMNYNP